MLMVNKEQLEAQLSLKNRALLRIILEMFIFLKIREG